MKDMFYYSSNNNFDGRCGDCPFCDVLNGTCNETESDVVMYIKNGHINKNCPERSEK